jgi:hypothetical protein
VADLRAQPGYGRHDLPDRAHRVVQVPPHVDPQRPSRVPGRLDRTVGLGQGLPGRGQEPVPGLGKPDGAGLPGEQGDAEFTLQPGDPLGQRLLGEEEPPGRPAEVEFLGGRDERPDLPEIEIHGSSLRRQPLVVNQDRALLDRPP